MPLPFTNSYIFLNTGVKISTDSNIFLESVEKMYWRFAGKNFSDEHEFQVITKSKDSFYCAAVIFYGYNYFIFKTKRGFVFSGDRSISGIDNLVVFEKGQICPVSYNNVIHILDTKKSPIDQESIFSLIHMMLTRSISSLLFPEHYILHAAALSCKKNGFILAGKSGFGKSSLSLALVKHGCKFLSDDIACVCPATQQLVPFPRSLNLRQNGLLVLRRLLSDREISSGPTDMEAVFPNSIGSTVRLRCLFLLQGFAEQAAINPVPQRQALLEALRLSHTPVRQPAQTLFRLASLFSQMRCYSLVVGDLDATADLICRQMEADAGR